MKEYSKNYFETYPIKELAEIRNGTTPSTKDIDNYGDDISWITPNDLSKHKSKSISKGERSLSSKGYEKYFSSLLPKGTILLSSRAPIGLLAIADTELCTNQGFKNIVSNEKVNNVFLYYYLKTQIYELNRLGTGTTFKEVSKSSLENYKITIPANVQYQQKIASILSALDDKIELNNQLNDNLPN